MTGIGYEFTVDGHGALRIVYPTNYRSCSIVQEKRDDLIFLKTHFSGTLLFINDDFDFFFHIDRDSTIRASQMDLKIYNNGDLIYTGYFTTNKGDFDVENRTFAITPETKDKYDSIFALWENEYNMILNTPVAIYFPKSLVYLSYCRWLSDVLLSLCQSIKGGCTVNSLFFTAVTDYITLEKNYNTEIVIASKSDTILPEPHDPATITMITFREMSDILRIMFNVYWDYDDITNAFTFEHVSYFATTDIINTRTSLTAKGKKKYSYLTDKLPIMEKFTMMDSFGSDFIGKPIVQLDDPSALPYGALCSVKEETRIVEHVIPVTTDVGWIYANFDISKDGFVMIATETLSVLSHKGYISGVTFPNTTLSWANLLLNYFRHDRALMSGTINDIPMRFCSCKKTLKQKEFSIENNDPPADHLVKFKTELGDEYINGEYGYPESIETTFVGTIVLNLVYGEPDEINYGVDDDGNVGAP